MLQAVKQLYAMVYYVGWLFAGTVVFPIIFFHSGWFIDVTNTDISHPGYNNIFTGPNDTHFLASTGAQAYANKVYKNETFLSTLSGE